MKLSLGSKVDTVLTAIALTATLSLFTVLEQSSLLSSTRVTQQTVEGFSVVAQERSSNFLRFFGG